MVRQTVSSMLQPSVLGYATVLNVRFITGDGATSPTLAAIQIVLTTLALASFAGIVGYFLGREKHEKRPLWWMTGGLVVAAALNGFVPRLRGQLTGGHRHQLRPTSG